MADKLVAVLNVWFFEDLKRGAYSAVFQNPEERGKEAGEGYAMRPWADSEEAAWVYGVMSAVMCVREKLQGDLPHMEVWADRRDLPQLMQRAWTGPTAKALALFRHKYPNVRVRYKSLPPVMGAERQWLVDIMRRIVEEELRVETPVSNAEA